jgi:hemolysin activation/secretion protein
LVRAGGSHLRALGTWQFRSALHLQYASGPLIPAEQFSLAGSAATRGFEERALATDSGVVVNLELYTPGFAVPAGLPGTLRGVLFLDGAAGRNHDVVSSVQVSEITVASAGAGLRGDLGRRAALLLDVASVIVEDTASSERRGDVKAHFAINLQF